MTLTRKIAHDKDFDTSKANVFKRQPRSAQFAIFEVSIISGLRKKVFVGYPVDSGGYIERESAYQ